ncbi:MAG: helix-turn-helix transcriptional regulator [Gammaproteobacteria bacterium]|nr:helix-turn-helix transcriptional regulator [Gammaproteobacteria bacterium]
MNVIGPHIKRLRHKNHITQEELTARCNLIGWNISRGTLAKIESQIRRVTDSEVELIAKVLKVEISELYKDSM